MPLEPGLTTSVTKHVGPDHTAAALGSGDVPLLATPQVLAWCEEATVAVVAQHLEAGESTVGMRVRLEHARPSGVGAEITVSAQLTRVDGRRLTFQVGASDGTGEIASGEIVRVVIDRRRFLDRLAQNDATPARPVP